MARATPRRRSDTGDVEPQAASWSTVGASLLVHSALVLFILAVLLPGPGEALVADYGADIDAPLPERALGQYALLKAHFEAPFRGYGANEVLIPEFAAVFLSHAAIGFLNSAEVHPRLRQDAARQLAEIARRVLSREVSPYADELHEVRRFGNHSLYLTHVALVLGAHQRISDDDTYDALYTRIVLSLAAQSQEHESAHAQSYPGSARFPADQAATLAALYLYDQGHNTHISGPPIRSWQLYMRRHGTDSPSQLPISSVTASYPQASVPRGCALSWTLLYMAQFAPGEARDLYQRYRADYFLHVAGLGGFREYPVSVDAPMNVDSGPILAGMGVAATGLGIGPARLFGDREGYRAMLRTASTVGLPAVLSSRGGYRLAPLLGEAILFHGLTARGWVDPIPQATLDQPAPVPWGAWLVVFGLLLWLALEVRHCRRLWRRGRGMEL